MYGFQKIYDFKILTIILLLSVGPFFLSQYHLAILNLILIYVIVILGFNIVLGYTGLFSLANAAFYGIGAYSTSIFIIKLGLPFYVALILGSVLTALIGLLICFLVLQTGISGTYVGMVTFAFAEFVVWVFLHWSQVTGGAFGLTIDPKFVFETGIHLKTYFITLFCTLLLVFFAVNIIHSKVGRALRSIRDSEEASMAMGINITLYKLIAFVLGAFYAALGGGLYSIVMRQIYPGNFSFPELLKQFSMLLIGGQGTIIGSLVGASILPIVSEVLRKSAVFQELFYGIVLGIFILFMPAGIYGLLNRIWETFVDVLKIGKRESKGTSNE